MAGLLADILQTPVRAVLGFFGGAVDGAVGKVDQSRRYDDGEVAQGDPSEKSRAGRFLSDHAGWRGGQETGEKYGKWGFALGAGYMVGHFLFMAMLPAIGFAAWPVIGSCLLIGATAFAGSLIGEKVGKYAGGIGGAIVGAVGGAVVGTYNGIFKSGYFKEPSVAEAGSETPVIAPSSPAQPDAPTQDIAQSQSVSPSHHAPHSQSGGFVSRLQHQRQNPARNAAHARG